MTRVTLARMRKPVNEVSPIMRALMHTGHGPRALWFMALASYAYSRGYGLSRWSAFVGALECAWSELRKR